MKNIFIIFICWITFIGCSQKEKTPILSPFDRNISALLKKINKADLDKKSQLKLNDEIYELISDGKNDSLSRDYFFQLAESYFNIKEYEKYIKICRELNIKCIESKDSLGLIKVNYIIANYHYIKYDMDSVYYYFPKAEQISLKVKEHPYLETILSSKADLLSFKKDFSRSEVLAIKSLKIALKKKNNRLIYDCYLTLGNALLGMNNEEKAIEYYHKAFKITEDLKSEFQYSSLKAQPYNYIGKAYQKKEDYKKSIIYFTQGLRFGDFKNTDPGMYCYLTNNLAFSKLKLGDKTTVLQFKEVLAIADSIQNIPAQVTSKIYLSEYYHICNDTAKALLYAQQAEEQAHQNKIFEDELKCLELLAKITPKKSVTYTSRFIKLTDSLQNNERATRDKYARIEYETDEIIKEKEYVISERDYISFQRWMILGIGLLIILVLSLWYVYTSQKNKNKELQLIQEQQRQNEEIYQLMLDQHQKLEEGKQLEKKRISQDLHDGVMGKLSGIRLNLYALSKKTDPETITKCLAQIPEIQNVEKEIRIIAHNLSTNLFSDNANFTQMVKNLFSNLENHDTIHFAFDIDEQIVWETINSNVKINIYRIIQEALHNISKYAQAKNVSLMMLKSKRGMAITIADDGKGFDTTLVKNGIGLKNMKNRVEDLGGQFEVQSQTNIGTKINFTIPI